MQPESDKWGWKHVSVFGGFDKGSGTKRWKCNHCNLRYNGSYSRVRAHLLGFTGVGVKSCPAIDGSLREGFQVLEEERLARKKRRLPGAEKPGKRIRTSSSSQQGVASVSKEDVDDALVRFVYANGLNAGVVDSPYFREMIKAAASYGSKYKPPTVDELCGSFFNKEKARIEKSLALLRESWPHTGCSVLCIGRFEGRLGCFQISIFVSSPRGLVFVKAFDVDNTEDGAEDRFTGILADVITEIGPANVFQIISHLDGADKLLSDSLVLAKFPHVFLSRCTSYSIRMLMEDIAEIDWIKTVTACTKEIEQYVSQYQSISPSTFPHDLKGSTDEDAPAFKFAPFFGTIQRIHELKQPIKEAVASDEWKRWKQSITEEEEEDGIMDIEAAVMEDSFWSTADSLLQLIGPFVRSLGALNVDRFAAGDVCNWRVQALEEARNKGIKGVRLNELEELIEKRWDTLFSPILAASYILNPRYFGRGQAKDKIAMRGWKATLERYESEGANRRVLREQLSSYWRLEGSLGDEDALDCRDKMDPVAWWESFGFETPHLQTLAIKVLSQVSSVTACREICRDNGYLSRETAKRLGIERVEDLVFVQNNLRIQSQKIGSSSSGFQAGSKNANPVLLLE